jgi:hypothetical protein
MSQQENDLNRLLRTGDEASKTNQKLIAAVIRTAGLILKAVPLELQKNLGYGYFVYGYSTSIPELKKVVNNGQIRFVHEELTVSQAIVFAQDVEKGFIKRLLEQVELYRNQQAHHLGIVDNGSALLEDER